MSVDAWVQRAAEQVCGLCERPFVAAPREVWERTAAKRMLVAGATTQLIVTLAHGPYPGIEVDLLLSPKVTGPVMGRWTKSSSGFLTDPELATCIPLDGGPSVATGFMVHWCRRPPAHAVPDGRNPRRYVEPDDGAYVWCFYRSDANGEVWLEVERTHESEVMAAVGGGKQDLQWVQEKE